MTWVPQNDVLAHPSLKAFFSHVGINSFYEVCLAICMVIVDVFKCTKTQHEQASCIRGQSSKVLPQSIERVDWECVLHSFSGTPKTFLSAAYSSKYCQSFLESKLA